MAEREYLTHNFEPVFDAQSRVLILGTFPSVKSREQGFYYGHPQNRFWRVIAELTGESVPHSIEEKKALLLRRHIALWDVIAGCTITGSSDASIRDAVPNDVSRVLAAAPIRGIFANGARAHELYRRYLLPITGREAVRLPSTSPANAACSLERLCEAWRVITDERL
ncbi:MAG: DNA-deoxyinosine glycosylase [Lachnospiraceae bacterium]|nr:DNA-deoxyinosine glycosylase [Lachnospiraceae bacterium]